MQYVVSM
jgi:hypothetical protein